MAAAGIGIERRNAARFYFLVNQTFRKPVRLGAAALTGVSLFPIMNKPRTLCGDFGSGLPFDGPR